MEKIKLFILVIISFFLAVNIPLANSLSQAILENGNPHDVGITSINSPVNGSADIFTPEVTIENFGLNDEIDVPVNMQIDKIIYGDSWSEIVFSEAGHWEQFDYASGEEYAPWMGTGTYFAQANAYINPEDVFDVGLFTPPFNLSGLSSVTLEFNMRFTLYDTDWGEVNTYSGGIFEENLAMYTTNATGHEMITFDTSDYTDPSEVYIEFYYNSAGQTSIYSFFSIDNVSINEIDFSEDFEEDYFPPIDITIISEYNETVTTNIDVGESKAVTFPFWVPEDLNGIDASITYKVTGCSQLVNDDNSDNDCLIEIITLDHHTPLPMELNITIIGCGWVDPLGGMYPEGMMIDLTAIPCEDWVFFYWDGDIEIGQEYDNPISIIMDSDKNITVCFKEYTIISIQPPSYLVGVGEEFMVSVFVEPAEPIMGVSFEFLYFDANLIHADEIWEGDLFGDYITFCFGEIDNENGMITDVFIVAAPEDAVNESGNFVNIIFTALDTFGTSELVLDGVEIADINGNPIPVKIKDIEYIITVGGNTPEITNITLTHSEPKDTEIGFGWENISCNVTDAIGVDEVNFVIVWDDHTATTLMTNIQDTDIYYFNTTLTHAGCYNYYIRANDTNGNENISSLMQFDLPPNEDVNEDGRIDFMDLVAIALMYNEHGLDGWVREDIDNDGHCYFMDLVKIVLRYNDDCWEQC